MAWIAPHSQAQHAAVKGVGPSRSLSTRAFSSALFVVLVLLHRSPLFVLFSFSSLSLLCAPPCASLSPFHLSHC